MSDNGTQPLGLEDVMDMYNQDIKDGGIRKLTDYERNIYAGAVLKGTSQLPYFADAYAVLRPFVDATAETAYTDQYARVGLGYWFFYVIDIETRVTWLTHEAMHILNNHFTRGESLRMTPERMNKMGDLEINTTLQTVPSMKLDNLLLPEKFDLPKLKTLEIYNGLVDEAIEDKIKEQSPDAGDEDGEESQSGEGDSSSEDNSGDSGSSGDSGDSGDGNGESGEGSGSGGSDGSSGAGGGGQGSSGSGSGSGSGDSSDESGEGEGSAVNQEDRLRRDIQNRMKGAAPGTRHCDTQTNKREDLADSAGIEKSSIVSQNIARNNTKARMVDHANSTRNRGDGTSNAFINHMISLMSPPKVSWRELFRRAVGSAYSATMIGRSQNSYKRVNRRYSQWQIIFPGTVDLIPTIMFAIDTSGSMGKNDYKAVLEEIEGILKQASRSRGGIKVFPVDTTVQGIQTVRSVKGVKLTGGGGTDMSIAFQYANELPKKEKPNIFVLGTDGYTDWGSVIKQLSFASYIPIILVTDKGGYGTVPDSLKSMATVICISEDD